MALNDKPLTSINRQDLQDLLDHKVVEDKVREYKGKLPEDTRDGKIKFLKSASSFANTIGGDLIFGIHAKDGIPTRFDPLDGDKIDEAKSRLENLLRDCILPRIPVYEFQPIPVDDKFVLILRIAKSFLAPHIITYEHYDKFYGRNSAGNYQLDVFELRTAFTANATAHERIKQFRLNRLTKVASGDLPIPLKHGAKWILHVFPLMGVNETSIVSPSSFIQHVVHNIELFRSSGRLTVDASRFNLDGLILYSALDHLKNYTYLQFFRNGAIEIVDTWLMRVDGEYSNSLPSQEFETKIIDLLSLLVSVMRKLGIEFPSYAMPTLIGVLGRKLQVPHNIQYSGQYLNTSLDRDEILLPEAVIDSSTTDISQVTRHVFDVLWNAFGYSRSLNYDDTGNRIIGQTGR